MPDAGAKTRARVLLADDHRMVLDAISALLARDHEVVGAVSDGQALLEAAGELRPDVVVTDLSMPGLNGLDALRRLRSLLPRARVLVLSMHGDPSYVAEALRAGAAAYLLKSSAPEELRLAIEAALNGHTYLTPEVAKDVVSVALAEDAVLPTADAFAALSLRQREVVQLVAEGLTLRQVAERLQVTPKTVEFHKYGAMKRLGLKTTAELVRYAASHGLVTDGGS